MIWVVGDRRALEAGAAEDDTPEVYYGAGANRCLFLGRGGAGGGAGSFFRVRAGPVPTPAPVCLLGRRWRPPFNAVAFQHLDQARFFCL